MTLLKMILAFLEALPVLDKWFQELQKAYIQKKVEKNDEEFLKAIGISKTKKSTLDLQRALGEHLD